MATLASDEKPMTGLPRSRATCPAAWTEPAKSGPMMSSAPSAKRLLRGRLRALGRAAIVLHEEGDVGALEFAERQFGGVAHALRHHGALPRTAHGQDQGDLDGAGADGGASA